MKNYWDKRFGEGVTDFFGTSFLDNLTPAADEISPELIRRLNELHHEATSDDYEDNPKKLQYYWNLYRAGVLLLGYQIGLYHSRNTYEAYTIEELTFILMCYMAIDGGEPEFVKKFWDMMVYLNNMVENANLP